MGSHKKIRLSHEMCLIDTRFAAVKKINIVFLQYLYFFAVENHFYLL